MMIQKTDNAARQVILEKLLDGEGAAPALTPAAGARLDALDAMNRTAVNRSYRDIPAGGLAGKLIRAAKRLVRRLTFWYVEPCMEQQSRFNGAAAAFAAHTNSELNRLEGAQKETERCREDIAVLLRQIQQMQQAQQEQAQREQALLSRQEHQERKLARLETNLEGCEPAMMQQNKTMQFSFSQSGEDTICRFILAGLGIPPEERTYLDLGANHAKFLSNTYSLYLDGAKGVLVEANPVLCEELRQERPLDTVVERCICAQEGASLDFYILSGDGLSTMDPDAARGFIEENPDLTIERTVHVPSVTMESLIRTYFPDGAPAVMDVDVEGMEMEILRQIDFAAFRPIIIICEMIDYSRQFQIHEKNHEILRFMEENGYREYAFTGINSIFVDERTEGGRTR